VPPAAAAETAAPAAPALPAEPAQPAQPAEPAATAPAPETAAPTAGAGASRSNRCRGASPRILILPAEFTVYQHGVATLEPVPKWTEDAQRTWPNRRGGYSLPMGASRLSKRRRSDDHEAAVAEHIELFKIIGFQLDGVVKPGGKAWAETRKAADYRIGPGLQFLKQQTGADYAFLLAGAEVRQTGGSVFMQLLLAGAGLVTVAAAPICSPGSSIWTPAGDLVRLTAGHAGLRHGRC